MLRRLASRLRPEDPGQRQAGFTIIEVLVAMMVFSFISLGVAYGLTNSLVLTKDSRSRAAATQLASADLDAMRQQASSEADGVLGIASGSYTKQVQVNGITYTVTRTARWVDSTGAIGACGTGAGTLSYKSVSETVTWPTSNKANGSVRMDTLIAPTSKLNVDTLGTIIVEVDNVAGAGAQGVDVAVSPTANGATALAAQPADTDADGCTFALRVTPGTYTVGVSRTGGIGTSKSTSAPVANPTTTVQVVAGGTNKVTFVYDQAATLNLQFASGFTNVGIPSSLPVTLVSADGTFTATTSPSSFFLGTSSATVSVLPYASGYRAIGGSYVAATGGGSATCVSPDPAQWTTPAAADQAVGKAVAPSQVSRGGVTTVSVPLGVFQVSTGVYRYLTAVGSATAVDGNPGCSAPMTLTIAVPITLLTTPTFALPYGTWQLYAGALPGATTAKLDATKTASLKLQSRGSVNPDGTITLDPRSTS